MVVVESYALAVLLCFITMLCWGSWANTQKLASKEWPFQLYYWDYAIGVFLLTLFLAMTFGSMGSVGRSFLADLSQASTEAFWSALLGGAIFNLANILLVAAIDIAGMAVAFPIGVGIALVLGVITNYLATPVGDPRLLSVGVAAVVFAIIIDALAYRKLPSRGQETTAKGIIISILAGVLMGFFYRFVAASMSNNFIHPEEGKFGPYSAVFVFSVGLFLSNFVWNGIVMAKPFVGNPVPFRDYFFKGSARLHLIGIVGGIIWGLGMSLSLLAFGASGPAISYGLGQGATMVAAFWGVFVWKEFKAAPTGTNKLLTLMFASFIIGLGLIVYARIA
jgi:glucose uptake protein